jgi:hypothetical protein
MEEIMENKSDNKTDTRNHGLRALIIVVVLVALAAAAYVLVSSVDIVTLLKRMHGG